MEQQRPQPPPSNPVQNPNQNFLIENLDSSNGGLSFENNTDVLNMSKEEQMRSISLPNIDLCYEDIEIMKSKPRMPK